MSKLQGWQVTDLVNQLESVAGVMSPLKISVCGPLGADYTHILISAGMLGAMRIFQVDGRIDVEIHATRDPLALGTLARLDDLRIVATQQIDRYKRTNRATDPR